MRILFAMLLAGGQAFAQQAPAPAKTTEQQARSYIASAFITGAAPAVISEKVTVSPELRQRLGLTPDADSKAVYQALAALTSGKSVLVRRAGANETDKAQAPAAPEKPLFAVESGDTTLIVQYDLDQDNIAFIGLPAVVAVAAPVVAPTPPQQVPEAPPEAPTPAPAQKPEPPGLQVVEPQAPRVLKSAAAPVRPVQPAAATPEPPTRPLLHKSGPCEIKPVMSDQDLVNCGATPR